MSDTLVQLLSKKAKYFPDHTVFNFLKSGKITDKITFLELDQRSRSLAVRISKSVQSGQPVLLLYLPGIQFIIGFFGCLYANVIPVPAYPPNPYKLEIDFPKLLHLLKTGEINHILTTSKMKVLLKAELFYGRLRKYSHSGIKNSELIIKNLKWITSDRLRTKDSGKWICPDISTDDIAFIQYTSGSTTEPKGVMLSHQNLLSNLKLMKNGFGLLKGEIVFSWLPPYHDMGLIGCILIPIYSNLSLYLMSPIEFVRRPLMWLELISVYKANISGAPNFAYEFCIKKISEQKFPLDLDLSSLRVAFSGAEPINPEMILEFGNKFSKYGFNPDSFYPCYGLAEATLFASGGIPGNGAVIHSFNVSNNEAVPTYNDSKGKKLVSCGDLSISQDLKILGESGSFKKTEGQIGEICISGKSVFKGYLNQPEMTQNAFIESDNQKKYLKTGDIGFIYDNQLFITGRKKEMMIIRGKNYFPIDIENTVQKSDTRFRRGCGAVFTTGEYSNTRLVALQEIKKGRMNKKDLDQLMDQMRHSVYSEHGIRLDDIMLLSPKAIPKTTSGKIKRIESKSLFVENKFSPIAKTLKIQLNITVNQESIFLKELFVKKKILLKKIHGRKAHELSKNGLDWVREYLNILLMEILKNKLSINFEKNTLADLGLDSITTIQMYVQIEKDLNIVLEESKFNEKKTLVFIVKHIVQKLDKDLTVESREKGHHLKRGDTVPLLPAQDRFFETYFGNPNQYNIILYVQCPPLEDINRLEAVLNKIISENSVFSMRFKKKDQQWVQYFHGSKNSLRFDSVSRPPNEALRESAKKHYEEMTKLINIEDGPVIVARHFKSAPFERGMLQLMISHLFSDYFSSFILINELEKFYFDNHIKMDGSKSFTNEDSYIKWALKHDRLYHDNSKNIQKRKNSENIQNKKEVMGEPFSGTFELNTGETIDLYKKYPTNNERHNLFLTVLCHGLEAIGEPIKGYIELNHHWRNNDGGDIDLRKTMGWIVTPYLIELDFKDQLTVRDKYDFVDKYLHSMQLEDKLKEFSKEKQKENNGYPLDSKIKFSYRSGIDEYDKINSRFKCYSVRFTLDPDHLPYYRIRFYAGKMNNRETWSFSWDPNQISNESIELFIQIYEQSLKELIYSG